MEKLMRSIEKELREVGEQGITSSNLDSTSKLVDMYKDLKEAEGGGQYGMRYRENYNYGENYNRGGYSEGYNDGNWTARGDYNERGYGRPYSNYEGRGGYGGYDGRMRDHLNRISEGAEMYEYGRDRYQHGGSEGGMIEGLEKMMYALCMFVESTMEFAQSPQEKEVIRKHISKIRNM